MREKKETEKNKIEKLEKKRRDIKEFYKEIKLKKTRKETKKIAEKYEVKKTKEQKDVIKGVNRIVEKISKKYGLDLFKISTKHIHILPSVVYKKEMDRGKNTTTASVTHDELELVINECVAKEKVEFASVILHEILHLNEIFTGNIDKNNFQYTKGVSIFWGLKESYKFNKLGGGLNEAIVSYLEKESRQDILNLPQLKKEKKWYQSKEADELIRNISKKEKIPKDEILRIDKRFYRVYSYRFHRKVLEFVLDEIQKKFSEKYENKDDVFKEFIRAQSKFHFKDKYFNKMGELIEETFGYEGWKILMLMREDDENDNENAKETYNKLKSLVREKHWFDVYKLEEINSLGENKK